MYEAKKRKKKKRFSIHLFGKRRGKRRDSSDSSDSSGSSSSSLSTLQPVLPHYSQSLSPTSRQSRQTATGIPTVTSSIPTGIATGIATGMTSTMPTGVGSEGSLPEEAGGRALHAVVTQSDLRGLKEEVTVQREELKRLRGLYGYLQKEMMDAPVRHAEACARMSHGVQVNHEEMERL